MGGRLGMIDTLLHRV